MSKPFIVYGLFRPNRPIFYIGVTGNLPRRLKEHRASFGGEVDAQILETGNGNRAVAEHRWIEEYRKRGHVLANRTEGGDGVETVSAETRKKLSAAGLGKKKPPGFGQKVSAALKGKPKNWSAEGGRRRAETQFKPGVLFSEELKSARRAGMKRFWAQLAPEERSRRMQEVNRKAWSRVSPEERSRRGEKIRQSYMKRPPEERSRAASHAARSAIANGTMTSESLSSQAKNWWARLSADEKKDFVERRAERIKEAKLSRASSKIDS